MSPLSKVLDNYTGFAKDALCALSSCIFKPSTKMKINGRTFNIIRVLGEGGFSFVYLVQDEHSGREFALKKIRCPAGSEDVRVAMREVEAYRRFRHPNIIRILDSAVVQDPEGEGKVVYLFLPLYKRGNLQDAINANVAKNTHFSEREMVQLFKGTCEAVRAMHEYRAPPGSQKSGSKQKQMSSRQSQPEDSGRHSDDDERFPQPEGDGDDGYSYGSASVPLVSRHRMEEDSNVIFDGDEETTQENGDPGALVHVPYAHRDLKPGNVMIADDGSPILMDFGSAVKARVVIENRSQALFQQDLAAEQSTMTYRAPELFDVKTGIALDEKVDIWSLGCTLFALAYSYSPFENTDQGGSIAMAVLNAQYKQPSSGYSQELRDLIDSMLKANPQDRPDIHQIITMTDRVLQSLA